MIEQEQTPQDAVVDELDGSSLPQQILGDAYPVLQRFHDKLMAEGEPRGLIGPRDVHIVWERHILNSAAVVPFIRKVTSHDAKKRVADVGSGGGFPGIVAAACLPDCEFTLIEPMERRVEWLEECVKQLGLENVKIVRARSEEIINQIRKHDIEPFAAVTCRAVAPMTRLSGWTLPLLKPHGQLIALKGRSAQVELDKAEKMIRKFHGGHARVCLAPVGEGLEPTHVVLVDKM